MESSLTYTRLPSGVHQMVFHDVQAPTLALWAERLKAIMDSTEQGETLRLMLYLSAVPSMQHLVSHIRSVNETHPTQFASRVGVIYEPSLQFSLLNSMMRAVVRNSTLHFFPKKDEAQAHAWILK